MPVLVCILGAAFRLRSAIHLLSDRQLARV
jgi:hypothetical protein